MTHAQRKLDHLHATFCGYTFWHVPATHSPDAWCWKPPGGTARDSQHRGTPEEVAAAITGTEHQTPAHATATRLTASRTASPDQRPPRGKTGAAVPEP